MLQEVEGLYTVDRERKPDYASKTAQWLSILGRAGRETLADISGVIRLLSGMCADTGFWNRREAGSYVTVEDPRRSPHI